MKRKSRKKIFNEIRKVFQEMQLENETSIACREMVLKEMDEMEEKYRPDWESVVMNAVMFIGVLNGTLTAEKANGIDDGDDLRRELQKVFELLAQYYANEQE